jgi:hypothetical protein
VGYPVKDRVFAASDLEAALRDIHDGATVIDEALVAELVAARGIDPSL